MAERLRGAQNERDPWVPPSDAEDRDWRSQTLGDRLEVVLVRGENPHTMPVSNRDDMDIDHIVRTRSAGEHTNVVCFLIPERDHVAAPKEAP